MLSKYYKILDLPYGASQEQIKKAYRKKAKHLHPDVSNSPESSAKFQEVHKAYLALTSNEQPTDLGLKTKKYKYTPKAPTDPKEYKWWYQETRKKAREYRSQQNEKYSNDPTYIAFRKKQRKLAYLLGALLFFILGAPLVFGTVYIFSENIDLELWLGFAVIYLCSFIIFFIGRKRSLRGPYKTQTN